VELPRSPWPGEVEFDCRTVSELNVPRWSTFGRRRRSGEQWRATLAALNPFTPPPLPVEVTLTRTGWSMLDEHDNLRIALKTVVDAIAEWLEVDDRDERIRWLYSQQITRETKIVQTSRGPVSCSVNRVKISIRNCD
jgi:hypothetical protein